VRPDSLVHVDFASVADSVGFWVSADGCPPGVATASAGAVRHDSWTGCSDETAVELYTADGGGHAWPGGRAGWPGSDEPAATLSASELIWEFFAAHPRFGPALA
jgi:polyhydroxybutyrate depolymerase